ncbi:MAG: thioesterase [Symploca sp. SIO3C6]|uniref:Thioesterase n=1 Tax=Symploca sp. SIO1C4 TaxID=2607765 RepID=A0A6B3N374_9CYAN|nr:thioesterase [Symploca sp. SIO3C6]NER28146.1 thioesterase [Symploca sp. SIO1C4]NET03886.1 thioesterase [Symploca sp. SIO2B6]
MKNTQIFNSWVTCPQPNPTAKLRLFCFHYAGGRALMFHTWPEKILPDIEVCPIELPGRGMRLMKPPFTHIQPLIKALEKALLPLLNKPFAFFGYSMGALISFELTRLLRRKSNLSPVHLFVCALHAPQMPDPHPPIHALPKSKFLQELRRYNGTPEEVLSSPELMKLFLPTLRADFSVLETYVYTPEAPLDCPITAFGGLQDWKASADDLKAWREQTKVEFSLEMFTGDHFFLNSSESLLLNSVNQKLHGYC